MFARHLIWSFAWAAMIAFMYFVPGKDLPMVDVWDLLKFDKIGHFTVFCIFAIVLKTGLSRQIRFRQIRQKAARWTLYIAVSYGGVLEYFQGRLIQDRTSDIWDFIANTVGVLVGIVIFRLIYGKQ